MPAGVCGARVGLVAWRPGLQRAIPFGPVARRPGLQGCVCVCVCVCGSSASLRSRCPGAGAPVMDEWACPEPDCRTHAGLRCTPRAAVAEGRRILRRPWLRGTPSTLNVVGVPAVGGTATHIACMGPLVGAKSCRNAVPTVPLLAVSHFSNIFIYAYIYIYISIGLVRLARAFPFPRFGWFGFPLVRGWAGPSGLLVLVLLDGDGVGSFALLGGVLMADGAVVCIRVCVCV